MQPANETALGRKRRVESAQPITADAGKLRRWPPFARSYHLDPPGVVKSLAALFAFILSGLGLIFFPFNLAPSQNLVMTARRTRTEPIAFVASLEPSLDPTDASQRWR